MGKIRDYIAAGGLALSMALMPMSAGCDKEKDKKPKVEKPDDVDCYKGTCLFMFKEQDNGLKVPKRLKDKLVESFSAIRNGYSLQVQVYDFRGDKRPDMIVVTSRKKVGKSTFEKRVMYFASKFDGKISEAYVDDLMAVNGKPNIDGYWDYRMFPKGEDPNTLTIGNYVSNLKNIVDRMNESK